MQMGRTILSSILSLSLVACGGGSSGGGSGSTGGSTTAQTFTFKVSSKPGFAGQKTYWFNAFDVENRLTHWVDGGSAQF